MNLFAFDATSSRTYDEEGRLRVALTPISKATVNPYLGREIPGYEKLGLDAGKIYQLLRDPVELEKAAATFNNVQLLDNHAPVNAANPRNDKVVGAIGSDSVFQAPYLRASLIVWDADAIKRIETDEQREISCGYRYDPDMTPGQYGGQPYDGVMRNIRGNHVALVENGRAGPDVLVGDAALKTTTDGLSTESRDDLKDDQFAVPSKRKLPIENEKHIKLAWDLLDDTDGLTEEEKSEARKRILNAARERDMDISDWKGATDASPSLTRNSKGNTMARSREARVDARLAVLKPFLANDTDLKALRLALDAEYAKDEEEEERRGKSDPDKPVGDEGETEEEKKEREEREKTERDKKKDDDKQAQDAAIKDAVAQAEKSIVERITAMNEAQRAVRPVVGDVLGMDSAAGVYKHALTTLGVDTAGVDSSAYAAMFKLAGQSRNQTNLPVMAVDSAGSLSKLAPGISRIRKGR